MSGKNYGALSTVEKWHKHKVIISWTECQCANLLGISVKYLSHVAHFYWCKLILLSDSWGRRIRIESEELGWNSGSITCCFNLDGYFYFSQLWSSPYPE